MNLTREDYARGIIYRVEHITELHKIMAKLGNYHKDFEKIKYQQFE